MPLSVIPVYVPGSGLVDELGPFPTTPIPLSSKSPRQLTCVALATIAVAFAMAVEPDDSEIVTVCATDAAPLYAIVIA